MCRRFWNFICVAPRIDPALLCFSSFLLSGVPNKGVISGTLVGRRNLETEACSSMLVKQAHWWMDPGSLSVWRTYSHHISTRLLAYSLTFSFICGIVMFIITILWDLLGYICWVSKNHLIIKNCFEKIISVGNNRIHKVLG